jgi:hypothetical protein
MRLLASLLAVCCIAILGGCSTDGRYTVSHEQLTNAAIRAICDEARVKPEEIKRKDREHKAGMITDLEARYVDYSKIKVRIDSSARDCTIPELEVKIATDTVLYTRHKEWERRVIELVKQKLLAHRHGEESKPTSLPPVAPPKAQSSPLPAGETPKPIAPQPQPVK